MSTILRPAPDGCLPAVLLLSSSSGSGRRAQVVPVSIINYGFEDTFIPHIFLGTTGSTVGEVMARTAAAVNNFVRLLHQNFTAIVQTLVQRQ